MGKLTFYAALCSKMSRAATQLGIPFVCFADNSKAPLLYNRYLEEALGSGNIKPGLNIVFEDDTPDWSRKQDSLEITFFDSRSAMFDILGCNTQPVREASVLKLESSGSALLLCFIDSCKEKEYLLSCFCFALVELLYQQKTDRDLDLTSGHFNPQEIFDLLPVAAYFKDITGKYVFANPHRASQMGVSVQELLSNSDYHFLETAEAVNQSAEEARVIETGTPIFLVRLFNNKERGSCWMISSTSPVRDTKGNIVGVAGMTQEIIDSPVISKFLIQALSQSALTSRIVSSLPILSYTLELSQGLPIIFLGGSPDMIQRIEPEPTHWADLVHPSDRFRIWTRLKRCCQSASGSTLFMQFRMLNRFGGFIYVMSAACVVPGAQGACYVQGIVTDTAGAALEIMGEHLSSNIPAHSADPLPQNVRAYLIESDFNVDLTEDGLRNENVLLKRDLIKRMAISDLLTRVIQSTDEGKTVGQIMEIMGASLALGRVFIFEADKNGEYLWLAHEWVESGLSSISTHVPKISYAAACKELSPGLPILMLNDLASAQRYKLACKFADCGEKSLILKGFFENGKMSMLIGISDSRTRRIWENEVDLETLSDILSLVASLNARTRSSAEAQNTLECFARVIDNVNSCILVCDYDTKRIIYANHRFINELVEGRDIVGMLCHEAFRGMPSAPSGCMEKTDFRNMAPHAKMIMKDYYHEPSGRWYSETHSGLYWVDGRLAHMICLVDITDNKHKDRKIWDMAYRDSIVGLANRAKLLMDFDDEYVYKEGMLVLINLDNFSGINLAFGYNYGNRLLIKVAKYLSEICGEKHVPYRLDKDEFAVVIFSYPGFNIYEFISELHMRFNEMWLVGDDENYYCGASMGVVAFPEYGSNAAAVLRNADSALHKAKSDGKGNIAYYQPSYSDATNNLIHMSNHLRAALLDCSELEVYYQPVIDTVTERCVGAEALIRWNSSAMGFVMPGAFIGIAEETGMIVQIGWHVLQTVIKDIVKSNMQAYGQSLAVNVNLSVKQLLNDHFLSELEVLVKESGIDPKMLVLEVTESILIFDVDMVVERLSRIRALGIRIALDDFGTGYSSLNNLRVLPLDIVKIDRSFIIRLGIDQYSTLFIQTIINLAHSLDLKVCAEGIETKEQLIQLRKDGCDTVQGYYFSKPVPFHIFEMQNLHPLASNL